MSTVDLDFLYSLKREGIKLDLDVVREFAKYLDNPQDSFKSFHIAGTNGKGSTSAFIYNALQERTETGLYTSPHLIDFNERIVSGRTVIPDEYIEKFIASNRGLIEKLRVSLRNPTFFETTTLLAFSYFQSRKDRVASIEVGLGGRLDSTNIITPEVSVITTIGYEHADKLGCSLEAIAWEKGGIIKKGRPVVLGDTKSAVIKEIKRISDVRDSKLLLRIKDCSVKNILESEGGTSFDLTTPNDTYSIHTDLVGEFQIENISNAVLALEQSDDLNPGRSFVEKGISNTRWPGRMEIISKSPFIMVDSAHNPPAADTLTYNYTRIFKEKPVLVIGMMTDKDIFSFLRAIRPISDQVIFTTPDEPDRAAKPEMLSEISGNIFREKRVIQDPYEAIEYAKKHYDHILVAGSMYLVGIIKKFERSNAQPFK
ncbi:MAG: bifunctional folylpolyglutamate synthase/dihydrofolate synthase [Thermoplasmata archaeon]